MRDLILDFKRGGASVPEVVHGIVRIWGTEVRPNGPSVVVTTETTLKLSDGKATLANAQTSGTGPLYEWAYIIQVEPFHGRNFRFYTAIPDGTGPVNLVDLPKLNPITGEGFYLDIEEWEALYGALPSRVDAVEAKNTSQDTKITTLEARPSGNATMRVDTTVGTRVFITDGVTERMVSGDTGIRNIASLAATAYQPAIHSLNLQRFGNMVTISGRINGGVVSNPGSFLVPAPNIPTGFRYRPSIVDTQFIIRDGGGRIVAMSTVSGGSGFSLTGFDGVHIALFTFTYQTQDPWPTTLPGTPA